MDIFAITETSQKIGKHFPSNIDIDGFVYFSTPSNLSEGGTAIYITDNIDSLLKIQNDDFESTWVEIE